MFQFWKTKKQLQKEIDELFIEKHKLIHENQNLNRFVYDIRLELAKERMNREKVVEFLEKNCINRINDDGSTTITLHSFIPKLSLLFVTRKELGVTNEWGV